MTYFRGEGKGGGKSDLHVPVFSQMPRSHVSGWACSESHQLLA